MNVTENGIIVDGNITILGEIINTNYLQLVVSNMKLKTKVINLELENNSISQDLLKAQNDIHQLKEMVNALWFAPNMPGYVTANKSFDEIFDKNN